MDQENQVEETENIAEQPEEVAAEQSVAQDAAPAEEKSVSEHREGDFVEPQQARQERAAESKTESGTSRFDRLADALGDLPDEPNDRLLEGIDEKTIEKLPVEAKVMMRHMLADRLREMERNKRAQEAAAQSYKDKEKELHAEARRVIESRAKMAEVFRNKELQDLLKKKDIPESKLPDPFTPEGIQARIDRATAQGLQRFIEPITKSAKQAQAEASYNQFVADHPNMMDKNFKSQVVSLIRQRKEAGVPMALKDAHDLIEHQNMVKEAQVKRQKERARRAESARKISRTSVSSDPDNGSLIPDWVSKKGYKGRRGAAATYLFLKDNPKIHAQVKKSQGRT
jgi:hypothetical protein